MTLPKDLFDRRARLEQALPDLPVFPLPNTVLFPGARMALHIFEPRYRQMLAHCMETHRCMAITQLIDGEPLADGRPQIASIASAGMIIEHDPLPDGRGNIVVLGLARVGLSEHPFSGPFRRANAVELRDAPGTPDSRDLVSLVQLATRFVAEVRERQPEAELSLSGGVEASRLADMIAQDLVLGGRERQAILECLDPRKRVRMVLAAIASQWGGMRRHEHGVAVN